MGNKATIGGKIVLEGEGEYRKALKNITASQKELRSEMELSQSTFRDSRNSVEALEEKCGILTKMIGKQSEQAEIYRKAIADWGKQQEEAARKTKELKESLSAAEKELAAMKEGAKGSTEALGEQEKAVTELKGQVEAASAGYDKASRKVSYYQAALNTVSAGQQDLDRELEETGKYLEEARKSSDGCAKSIDQFGNRVEEAAEETSVFGDVLKAELLSGAIRDGIRVLADGIGKIATSAVDAGSTFEESMSQVAATMGITVDEIREGSRSYEMMSAAAKECGKSTMFSASESAEAMNYLALAGYSAEKSVRTLPKVLDLAAAGGMDLAYASDLVTDNMAALAMETEDLDMYINQMARTSQKSNTSIAQLGEATLVCAGTVEMAGQSITTMNTELGILANNGIKGAEGGTKLRNIILSLAAPTDVAADAIEELGLKVSDSSGDMRDLNSIMTDLDAAMEGMSSTKKTMIISRIFNKTDIAAVNYLLKGTGEEFDTLSREIEDSSGAAREMAETLNDNLKGKVTILKSALEGLGISAYEIFDEEMKGSVDAATGAVGRLQRSIDSGDLGLSLRRLSKSMEGFLENVIGIGEEALPVFIDGLGWILDHSDMIVAGVSGIAAANLEMKVVAPAVEAVTTAWSAYKTANENAAVAQWTLNGAMNANPAGILVTALVGLTTAVAAYAAINRDSLAGMDETTKKTLELVEATEALNAEYKADREAREQTRTGMEQEQTAARKLVDELEVLQAKTKLTATEEARQKQVIQELNTAYPELNLQIDEQTGLLNMSADAIYKNIDAMAALDRANAVRKDMVEITEKQWEAQKQLASLNDQLIEQEGVLAEKQAAVNEAYENLEKYREKYGQGWAIDGKTTAALNDAKAAYEGIKQSIADTEASISSMTQEYQFCYEYMSENEALYQTAEAAGQLGDAARKAGEDIEAMSREAVDAIGEMYGNLSELVAGQMDLFAQFDGQAKMSTEELLKNMQSQVDGVAAWSENLGVLAERGINQGLLKYLAEMGPQGAGYVATFVEMTDEELKDANRMFEEAMALPAEAADNITESYMLAGENAAEGFRTGIRDNAEEAAEEAGNMGDRSVTVLYDRLDEHSPSRKTREAGANFAEGFRLGVSGGTPAAVSMAGLLGASVLAAFRDRLCAPIYETMGRQVAAGLEQGIRAGTSGVVRAVEEMCTAAVEKARAELDIHSPSGKFRYFGEMSGEGYMEGWEEYQGRINAMIRDTLPDTVLGRDTRKRQGTPDAGLQGQERSIQVNQEINIYARTDDPVETARKFRQTQREAAEEW